MAQLSVPGSEAGTSDFERGVDTGEFLLAKGTLPLEVGAIVSVNDAADFAISLRWAAQEYGEKKIKSFLPKNLLEFVNILGSLAAVPQVDIWAHGSSAGAIALAGHEFNINSRELREAIGTRQLSIRTVEFQGCNIGNNPPALAAFGRMIGAKEVIGWTQDHILHPVNFEIRTRDFEAEARSIATRFRFLEPFLPASIPRDQPSLAAFLRHRGGAKPFEVILEYWSSRGLMFREIDQFIKTPVAELGDIFNYGFPAKGRREAERLSLRDIEAREPLIKLTDVISNTGDPLNPFLSRVSVSISEAPLP